MFGAGWTEAVALAAAFTVSALSTPAGISGAILLLPFQVTVLPQKGGGQYAAASRGLLAGLLDDKHDPFSIGL